MALQDSLKGVARDTLFVGGLGVAGQGLVFVLHVFLARQLGASEYGIFAVVIAWVNALLMISTLGQDRAAMRFVPVLLDSSDELASYYRFGMRIIFAMALVLAIAFFLGGEWLLAGKGSTMAIACGASFLLGNSLLLFRLGVLRGMHQPLLPQFLETVARPSFIGLAFLVAVAAGLKPTAVVVLSCFALASFVLQWPLLRRLPGRAGVMQDTVIAQRPVWLRTGIVMSLCSGALVLMYSLDVIMLNWFAGAADAGVYSVMSRLSILVIFGMNCAQIVISPKLSRSFSDQDLEKVKRFAALASLFSALFGLAISALLLLFGEYAIALFGREYLIGMTALQILVCGQILNLATGITGAFMNMVGEPRRLLVFVLIGLVANIAMNLFLIPRYGGSGAAIASVCSHFLWNIIAYAHVLRRYRVDLSVVSGLRYGVDWLKRAGS